MEFDLFRVGSKVQNSISNQLFIQNLSFLQLLKAEKLIFGKSANLRTSNT